MVPRIDSAVEIIVVPRKGEPKFVLLPAAKAELKDHLRNRPLGEYEMKAQRGLIEEAQRHERHNEADNGGASVFGALVLI